MTAPGGVHICLVGGGFSGMMTAYHLSSLLPAGSAISIIEPGAHPGRGLAYGTENPRHLLNVRASHMSALPQDPQHLVTWLHSPAGHAATRAVLPAQHWPETGWQDNDFIPRALFARYLDSLYTTAQETAARHGITLRHIRGRARSLEAMAGGYTLTLESDQNITASAVVLALGNLDVSQSGTPQRWITNVWSAHLSEPAQAIGPIALIGSGLTAIDMILSLRDAGYTGHIEVFSRHGWWPHEHAAPQSVTLSARARDLAQQETLSLGTLRRALRADVADAVKDGGNWQRALDSWRSFLPALWTRLGIADRKRFLARLFTAWNIHRHRMAPAIAAILAAEESAGRLHIHSGGAQLAAAEGTGHIMLRGTADRLHRVSWVLDCRGPGYHLARTAHPLLTQMQTAGLALPHATGWGLDVSADFALRGPTGQTLPGLYAIGPLAIGARLESTAVPELRQQAAELAESITSSLLKSAA